MTLKANLCQFMSSSSEMGLHLAFKFIDSEWSSVLLIVLCINPRKIVPIIFAQYKFLQLLPASPQQLQKHGWKAALKSTWERKKQKKTTTKRLNYTINQ